ncbi:MAG: hypothetical protein OXH15_22995 [Gammaproteobacteria bacterium]|nr:hypothetical protein [Gammaproteobacteria bacterium]
MIAWRNAVSRLRTELEAKPRVRLGAWVVIGLLLVFGLTIQSDRLAEATAAYADESRLLAGAQTALERKDWPELLAAEQSIHGELAARFWQAETEGLAQAQLQQALRDVAERLDLRDTRILASLTRAVPDIPGVCQVQARFRSTYRRGDELRLLYALATFERKLVADRLELSRRNSAVSVMVSAYFIGLTAEACSEDGDPE